MVVVTATDNPYYDVVFAMALALALMLLFRLLLGIKPIMDVFVALYVMLSNQK